MIILFLQEISVLKQVVLGLRSSRDHDSFLRSTHNKSKQVETTLLTSNNTTKQTTNKEGREEPTLGKPIVFVSFFFLLVLYLQLFASSLSN